MPRRTPDAPSRCWRPGSPQPLGLSHLTVATVGGTLVLALGGLGFGLAGAASTGDDGLVGDLLTASLAYAPALWVTAGLALALYGWVPRATAAAWLVPVHGFVAGYLGESSASRTG